MNAYKHIYINHHGQWLVSITITINHDKSIDIKSGSLIHMNYNFNYTYITTREGSIILIDNMESILY